MFRRKRKKMMYESKMVCCLKANGKVLREHKDTVYVPFGTEYSILIKNLNSLRAMVNVSIDGKDVTDGKADFIVNANSEIDLARFLPNGNMERGNKFKFIERTASVEQHRGVGVEDGIIRIEFQFERQYIPSSYPSSTDYWRDKVYFGTPGYVPFQNQGIGMAGVARSVKAVAQSSNELFAMSDSTFYSTNASYAPKGENVTVTSYAANDAGITVPGSISDQSFKTGTGFALDGVKHVMILRLLGETPEGKKIIEPVTVKAKPKCVTCGRVNKATSKFCSTCGTSLEIG